MSRTRRRDIDSIGNRTQTHAALWVRLPIIVRDLRLCEAFALYVIAFKTDMKVLKSCTRVCTDGAKPYGITITYTV